VHERYRQTTDRRQTDGRAIAYSEREREFTFAKKSKNRYYLSISNAVRPIATKFDTVTLDHSAPILKIQDRRRPPF